MITWPIVSAARCAGRFEELVGRADAELVEEDLVQLVVVVLAGVHQRRASQCRSSLVDDARQPDDLRPRADDGHHLKHATASRTRSSCSSTSLTCCDVEALGVVRGVVVDAARSRVSPSTKYLS